MEVIFTDKTRNEQGVLHNFDIDFDTTNTKDFQITVGSENNVLQGGSYWYIEGTEYGGKVDKKRIITESRENQYSGRNARGLLASKIIEPPQGSDYLILSGTLQEVIQKLLTLTSYSDLFVADKSTIMVSGFKFDRYINLYEGIVKLMSTYGKIPKFTFKKGMVHIGAYESVDYSDDKEYTQDDLQFTITKSYSDVNHLICLGKGELKDRMVIHLYADANGNISEIQTMVGEYEVAEVYENTNVESREELLKEGTARLKELKNTDSFEVTAPDIDLKIGDIIGGIETNSETYVAKDIVNIVAKINDHKIELEYKVGEDDCASSSSSSGDSTSSGGVYNLPPATKDTLGGVIVGDGLSINDKGIMSANKQTSNDYTNTEKAKLKGIEEGATKTVIDKELNDKSENPVQNNVVTKKLNEVFQCVSDGKSLIASAITDMGVDTDAGATFEVMAENIKMIEYGGAIITKNVLSYYSNDDTGIILESVVELATNIDASQIKVLNEEVVLEGVEKINSYRVKLIGNFYSHYGETVIETLPRLFFDNRETTNTIDVYRRSLEFRRAGEHVVSFGGADFHKINSGLAIGGYAWNPTNNWCFICIVADNKEDCDHDKSNGVFESIEYDRDGKTYYLSTGYAKQGDRYKDSGRALKINDIAPCQEVVAQGRNIVAALLDFYFG